jgi:dihydroflavonol-4-reductase
LKNTVLVTGAAGHIGNNIVRELLARGRTVRMLEHVESGSLDGLSVEKRRGDILDRQSLDGACEGVEVVYHCAAIVSIVPTHDPRVLRTNTFGTKNVVDACLAHGVTRLVHISSIHALAPGESNGVTDESCAPNLGPDVTSYDRSKAEGEVAVRAGIDRGLDAVIVNPTAVIGPHDYIPHLFGRALIDMYLGKLPMSVAGGFNWVDARDVAKAALAAEARGRAGERYLLSGRWASIPDIAAMMETATGRRGPRLVAPLWLAKLGVPFLAVFAALTRSQPLYTASALRALSEHRDCRNAKARSELGFAPRPLERTIADTFAFYAQAGLLERGAKRGKSLPAGAFIDPPAPVLSYAGDVQGA